MFRKEGFSLFEVLIALLIFSIGVGAIISYLIYSIKMVSRNFDSQKALMVASFLMEETFSLFDSNISLSQLNAKENTYTISISNRTETFFWDREITPISPYLVEISIKVYNGQKGQPINLISRKKIH